jgi:hypothetical protein
VTDVAFLISTFLWMAWLIYGLRVAAERDHWRRRFEATRPTALTFRRTD